MQYIHSPFGDMQAATKSPPSLLPDEKLFTTYIYADSKNDNYMSQQKSLKVHYKHHNNL